MTADERALLILTAEHLVGVLGGAKWQPGVRNDAVAAMQKELLDLTSKLRFPPPAPAPAAGREGEPATPEGENG